MALFSCLLLSALMAVFIPQRSALQANDGPNQSGDQLAATSRARSGTENRQAAASKGKDMPQGHPLIVAEFSTVDVEPDGNLEKPFWAGAKAIQFDADAFSRTAHPEAETRVASRWSQSYLYLAFWCRYQSLHTWEGEDPTPERWELWEKDVVEAFIGPDPGRPSHYYEFEVAPNNQWVDLEIDLARKPFNDVRWNSGFHHATRIDPVRHIWTAEWRIPVASMTTEEIRPGAEWKLNFYRCDGSEPRRMLSWGALPLNLPANSFHQPASFGTLRFGVPGQKTAP